MGRQVWFPLGHYPIYPNQYILLTGSPGCRKGSAIKIGTGLLKELEYKYFAPNHAAREALWEWLSKQYKDAEVDEWIDEVIDDQAEINHVAQAYIAQDEFIDFCGVGNDMLMSSLTNLWDNISHFTNPKTKGRNIEIYNPTLNILSGITPHGIHTAFSSLANHGGFFSRILFVFSQPTNKKIAFPSKPNYTKRDDLVFRLQEMSKLEGELTIKENGPVFNLIKEIYHSAPKMPDPRFEFYSQRRQTHLLKLITTLAISDMTLKPTTEHVILANSILAVAEAQMPNALGEYGQGKHSTLANKVLDLIASSDIPLTLKAMFRSLSRDIDKGSILQEVLSNLISADRIQKAGEPGKVSYILNQTYKPQWDSQFVDYSLLHPHEHNEDLGANHDSVQWIS